jgi:hypothetical protein
MNPLTIPRVLNGPEAARVEDRKRELLKRKDLHPYTWLNPPPESIRVHAKGAIAIPAANTPTQVLSFQVPNNMFFWFTHVLQLYIGGNQGTGVLPGDGTIAWDWDVNLEVGGTNPSAYQIQGFSEILGTVGKGNFPLGNFQVGLNSPYPLVKPELLGPEDILRNKVTVNATPAGGFFVAMADGWLVKYDF